MDAPELRLEGDFTSKLVGKSMASISPDKPIEGCVDVVPRWNQFYRIGSQAFALPEAAWEYCEPMYYGLRENSIEFPAVRTALGSFAIINPLQFLSKGSDPAEICDLRNAGSIFRIEAFDPATVFCLEGLPVPNDEFKNLYARFAFEGLHFQEIWCSASA